MLVLLNGRVHNSQDNLKIIVAAQKLNFIYITSNKQIYIIDLSLYLVSCAN